MLKKVLKESDIKRFSELIEKSERVVLTCHVRPDGDAIGSTLGFCHVLRTLGKEAKVVTPDQPPRSLQFLPGFSEIVCHSKYPDYSATLVSEADLLICCDFNQLSRLDQFAQLIGDAKCPKVMIDHHLEPESFCDLTFSFPEMSSASELTFRVIAALGLYSTLNKEGATCLCTGLITDTQNFMVNCADSEVYEVLMKLLDKGVDKQKIVREALRLKTFDSFRLQMYALDEKLELHADGRMAVVTLSNEELEKFRYVRGDSEGIVDRPLDIRGVVCSFFLREDPTCIKVSARSMGDFPVNRICKALYGGGGHVMAAGGEFEGTLEECRKLLLDCIPEYRKELADASKALS